jgi:hypothetical protein
MLSRRSSIVDADEAGERRRAVAKDIVWFSGDGPLQVGPGGVPDLQQAAAALYQQVLATEQGRVSWSAADRAAAPISRLTSLAGLRGAPAPGTADPGPLCLDNVHTALDLEEGLEYLQRLLQEGHEQQAQR